MEAAAESELVHMNPGAPSSDGGAEVPITAERVVIDVPAGVAGDARDSGASHASHQSEESRAFRSLSADHALWTTGTGRTPDTCTDSPAARPSLSV